MAHDRIHQDALDLINKVQASGEAMDVAEADWFIVSAYDPETDRRSYIGPFADPIAALRWANDWANDLNSGNGPDDTPFSTAVHPMMEPR